MPNGDKPTVNEHFVPRVYLKGFSEVKVKSKKEKALIWQYCLKSMRQIPTQVDVESVCADKNLYEFRNEKGEIIYTNMIENLLGIIEGIFADTMRSINRKAFDKRNLKTSCFLTADEKSELAIYIAIQQLRFPWFIDELEDEIKKKYENILEKTSIRNLAIISSLPIYKSLSDNDKSVLLNYFDRLSNMAYFIGVSNDDCIITSDNPSALLYDDNHEELVEVIFPLSSKLVLIMKPFTRTKPGFRNRLIELSKENIEYINQITIRMCKQWIYSRNPLSHEQIDWIMEDRS